MSRDTLALTAAQTATLDQVKRSLSPRERIAQLIHPILWAHWDPESKDRIFERVIATRCGGAFMGTGGRETMRALITECQEALPVPLLISGDHECGCRSAEATPFGSAMNFGAIPDLHLAARLTHEASAVTAREARDFGCHWSFSPVVDINFNRENPITNHRAYGDTAERVAVLGAASIRGLQENGIAATAKHFPGDGVDSRDQHLVTTVNTLSPQRWKSTYGQTFGAAFDAGVMAVMTGWIALLSRSRRDALSGQLLPAPLDPNIQIDLLREEMEFQGLVITDAFGMGGLWSLFRSEAECAVESIKAGADMLLFIKDVPATILEIERALNDGRLPETRINQSLNRILAMKLRLGLFEAPAAVPPPSEQFDDRALELSQEIAERSLTLVHDLDGIYPLQAKPGSRIVLFDLPVNPPSRKTIGVGEDRDAVLANQVLAEALTSAGYHVSSVANAEPAHEETADADVVIYMMFVCPSAGRGTLRMSAEAFESIDWLRVQKGLPTYFVSFGNPYALQELPTLRNYACGYSRQPNIIRAYARALLGEIPFQGVSPVDLARTNWSFEEE